MVPIGTSIVSVGTCFIEEEAMPWHVSQDGPDWTDISVHLATIKCSYKVDISMIISPASGCVGSSLLITVLAFWNQLGLWDDQASAAVSIEWPHRDHKTIEGAVIWALYTIEEMVAKETEYRADTTGGAARGVRIP